MGDSRSAVGLPIAGYSRRDFQTVGYTKSEPHPVWALAPATGGDRGQRRSTFRQWRSTRPRRCQPMARSPPIVALTPR
jgi:hypothetical protein